MELGIGSLGAHVIHQNCRIELERPGRVISSRKSDGRELRRYTFKGWLHAFHLHGADRKEDGIMGILDVLRKLGILRYGAKAAVYHDAAGRPVEFMMDGVFNAEKDLAIDKSERTEGAGNRSKKQMKS